MHLWCTRNEAIHHLTFPINLWVSRRRETEHQQHLTKSKQHEQQSLNQGDEQYLKEEDEATSSGEGREAGILANDRGEEGHQTESLATAASEKETTAMTMEKVYTLEEGREVGGEVVSDGSNTRSGRMEP
ncbi:hypothetical protein PIB30_004724 [Stylosanthes scabra]|uniref:Uncharacterized protein n=1 Tax=Stylosanthes scabra TaxID=79078 RepID=A0ABU6S3R7_9FABA|nr:hypothetical protein [Stylosanthes scabra]